jgi:hypothetical protein
LWKLIEAEPDNMPQTAASKIDRLTRASGIGNPGKTYIGLKIFEELGLIALNEADGALGITLQYHKGEGKVDLTASEILKRLQ